jgi:hypothetical protein
MSPHCEDNSCFLRKALVGNALFSTLSGLIIVFGQSWVLRILGLRHVSLLILGLGLIVFAATLVVNARRQEVDASDAWIAVWMDVAWVLGSYVLIFIVPFSTGGKWVVGLVAELVLAFAILQFVGIRRLEETGQLG